MQKTRRLMDNNGLSFQMLLIQLSFTTVCSESQIYADQVTLESNKVLSLGGACAEAMTAYGISLRPISRLFQ